VCTSCRTRHPAVRHRLPHPRAVPVRATDKLLDDRGTGSIELPPVVILRLRNMTAIDATGLRALEELADNCTSPDADLILCGAREAAGRLMRQAEFERHVGRWLSLT
jgi:MFS superfamily sulfate permease-like transporter